MRGATAVRVRRGVGLCTAIGIVLGTWAGCAVAASPSSRPAEWPRGIKPLVEFVEHERGLRFEHPVPVRFGAAREIRKALGVDDPVTPSDRRSARRSTGQLRALGLADEEVDVGQTREHFAAEVYGLYDPATKRIPVRGDDLADPTTRVVVVHELVHALQDQHFDLRRMQRRTETSSAALAVRALIEGDAVSVEREYLWSLPEADRQSAGSGDSSEGATGDDHNQPAVVDAVWQLPYVNGATLVSMLKSLGRDALDDAFRHPPSSDAPLFDPVAVAHLRAIGDVRAPRLAPAEIRSGRPDTLGALIVYVMLATRIDEATALRAVTGYVGDRMIGFRRGGRECVRFTIAADDRAEAAELGSAFGRWAGSFPVGMAEVANRRHDVVVSSCETAGVVGPSSTAVEHAFFVTLDNRLYATIASMDEGGVKARTARCIADALVTDPFAGPILDHMLREGTGIADLDSRDRARYVKVLVSASVACS